MNKHTFLLTVLATSLLLSPVLSGCAKRSGQRADAFELTVLHSNDTHSYLAGLDKYGNACFKSADCVGGAGRLATVLKAEQAKGGNVLALDAGDRFQGTLFYTVNKSPMITEVDKQLPYDAMTLGNHEFDDGCAVAADFVRTHSFPVLAANLNPQPGCALYGQPVKAYLVRELNGVKVGIVGLANPDVINVGKACPQTRFTDSRQALQQAVDELTKQGVRHIVAVTHLGLPEDRLLARSVDGVDVIVGGHTHTYLGKDAPDGDYPQVEQSPSGKPVLVVTAKSAGEYLGKLHVVFTAEGVPQSWTGAAERLDKSITPDPAVEKTVEAYVAKLDSFRAAKLGQHNLEFADGMDACRTADCLAGLVATDAMLEYARPYGAVAALCNGGGLRAPLKRGELSQGDLLAVLPFASAVVVRQYTGAQILAALEHGVSGENAKGPKLLQVSGLHYSIDPARPVGKRLLSAQFVDLKGKASKIDPQKTYKIAVPDFLARGGDAFAMLAQGTPVPSPDSLDVDIVGGYIKAHSPLTMPRTDRITRK